MNGTASGAVTNAIVERFDEGTVSGWVEQAARDAGNPVRVGLFVGESEVATAWAVEVVDASQRRGGGPVRVFRFALRDLWSFLVTSDRISVRIEGRTVPIAGEGTYVTPGSDGPESLENLRALLADGYIFSPDGRLQLSKTVDAAWQRAVLDLYARVAAAVRDLRGYDTFVIYGTLLGAVRDGGFIGHDREFDCAYLSAATDGAAAARELQEIAFGLIDRGFRVHASDSALHIADTSGSSARISLFHLFVDSDGDLQFPFGVTGTTTVTADTWTGTAELGLGDAQVQAPSAAESVLEQIYGGDWRTPDPGFTWNRDRTHRAATAVLPDAAIEEVYWADFYAHTTYDRGSTFFEMVSARSDMPATVIDIGCGDGRDSFAFAQAGRKVTGIDRSHIGIRLATKKAEELGLAERLRFSACDVGDADLLRRVLADARRGSDDPVLCYARFFLHSIPEDVQETLMSVLAEFARPGDRFAAEFRTDRDEAIAKVHGEHYRRFQNGAAFGRALADRYGFTPVLEQEGNGFSPYKGEDPQLYRVIAVR
jgi:SAM-dependent methyltransferase